MFKKILTSVALCATVCCASYAQTAADFKEVCDSLTTLVRARTTVAQRLRIDKVETRTVKKVKYVDIYFTNSMSDFHWSEADITKLRADIEALMPESCKDCKLGELYCKTVNVKDMVTPDLAGDGQPGAYKYRYADPRAKATPFIEQIGADKYAKGMSGRYVALWQSHGRYYEQNTHRWEWQRAPLHTTVEDMYTQSYVIPFLIPMLENAGAYVLTPRERDTNREEIVADNDPAFTGERGALDRKAGTYTETGVWSDAGVGFADAKKTYFIPDNPFIMGTARQANCITAGKGEVAKATWTAPFSKRGEYAVYISYKSLPNSTKYAHYTVKHMGGTSEFCVNQQIGGGTWIYLGTFEFDKEGSITVDNVTPEGKKLARKSVVTADGVKIGGGMGKVARGMDDEPVETYRTSGLPAFTEGAMYWMQTAGVDTSIYKAWDRDYTNDYASRGAWVKMMKQEKGVPFDLSLAFHSDAGSNMDDEIVGVLSIYTLLEDDSRKLPDGKDRMTGRLMADLVQDQIITDIRDNYEPLFSKRYLWDRSYSESRTTGVPGMLLELLSHHNFADMKYGLDPSFRFTVSRAVYKGMLKFLSNMYGTPYAVQPLPVNTFSVRFGENGTAALSWKETVDTKEPTATPQYYIVYTRVDGGAFDEGVKVEGTSANLHIDAGHIYSYKVVAANEGGKSFPSEILSIGIPTEVKGSQVLVINNFDRVSAPAWYESQDIAGFAPNVDMGVPYLKEINFIGDVYQHVRRLPWTDDDNPGFGSVHPDKAGMVIAGNSFDYPYIHGKALMALGRPFCSENHKAFEQKGAGNGIKTIDIICGKQVSTMQGRGAVPNRFQVFPQNLQDAISEYTANGGNIIISGANIATDAWESVYHNIKVDEEYTKSTQKWIEETLGYKWLTSYGAYTGEIEPYYNRVQNFEGITVMPFYDKVNETSYCVENPDGINPAGEKSQIVLRYTGESVPAAIVYNAETYKVASFGFPIEVLKNEKDIEAVFRNSLEFFAK